MALIGIFLGSLLLGGLIFLKYLKTRPFKSLDTVPGPKPLPLFGDVLLFKHVSDVLPVYCDFLKKYGNTFTIWLGPLCPNVITADHKLVQSLLCNTKNLNKGIHYRFLANWLGQGLLTSKSERWRKHRKILTPAFHFQILTKFVAMFERPTMILLKNLEKKIDMKSFDIFRPINLYSLDVMCETSMGARVYAQENEESDYVCAVKEMGRIIMDRTFSLLKQFDFFYKFSRDFYKEKNALKILHGYTNAVIKKRRSEIEEMQRNSITQDFSSKEKPTFLDVLILSEVDGKPLSDEAIREEVDTFMFEGHDTSSAGAAFALYSIANHPEVQEAILEEQIQIFGKIQNPNVNYNDLHNMKYLDSVIKETLRLYPSVPIYGRELIDDIIVDGQTYPSGLNCYIFAYGIHRNPEFFPDPDEFKPSRFLDMENEQPFAYIPFSAGQRNCIGQKFAMLELKYVLSAILRNYELEPAIPNVELFLVAESILRSHTGINIKIKRRNY